MAEAGKGMMTALADGIKAMASAPIDAIVWVFNKLRSYLPGSDADTGPLSDVTASGMGFMQAFANGTTQAGAEVVSAVTTVWGQVDAQVARLATQSQGRLTAQMKKEQAQAAKDLVAQRSFDNLTKIEQMQQQAAAEIALAQRYGQNTLEIEKYWQAQIAAEQSRAYEAERQQAEQLAEQRANDQLSKLDQLKNAQAAEIALLQSHGQDTTATQLYYAQQIADEQERIRQENLAREIEAMEMKATIAQTSADLFTALYELSGEESRTFFELAKAAAVAQAIINTYLAATKALAEGGPFAGPVLAGLMIATGMAQVAKIVAQKPALAEGGIVTGPTEALIGEAGPEAVIPLDRMGQFGGGGDTYVFNASGVWTAEPSQMREFFRQNIRYVKSELER
jgi:hypothetical protein